MKYTAGLLILAVSLWQAYEFGVEHEAGRQAKVIKELKANQAKKTDIVYKEKVKIEVKYRDRVKTIYQTADPTGCLDTTLGDIGLFKPSDN